MTLDASLCPFSSGELCTFLWAIIPLLEMRAAVPLGILKFELSVLPTIFYSFLGGLVVALVCLWILPHVLHFMKRYMPTFYGFIDEHILSHTRQKHSAKMEVLGEIFLVLFVAVPLPGSGAFTGALIGYLFGIPFWRAFFLVGMGVLGSNAIMALITVSGNGLWGWISGLLG